MYEQDMNKYEYWHWHLTNMQKLILHLFVSIGTMGINRYNLSIVTLEIIENWGICRDQSFGVFLAWGHAEVRYCRGWAVEAKGWSTGQETQIPCRGQNIFNPYGGRWGCYELFQNLWDFRKMTSPLRLRGKTRPWDNRSQSNGCDRGMALNTRSFFDSNGLILWMSP